MKMILMRGLNVGRVNVRVEGDKEVFFRIRVWIMSVEVGVFILCF